jgi:hypothetical protein
MIVINFNFVCLQKSLVKESDFFIIEIFNTVNGECPFKSIEIVKSIVSLQFAHLKLFFLQYNLQFGLQTLILL